MSTIELLAVGAVAGAALVVAVTYAVFRFERWRLRRAQRALRLEVGETVRPILRVTPEPKAGAPCWRVPECECGDARWKAERVMGDGSLQARCLSCGAIGTWSCVRAGEP